MLKGSGRLPKTWSAGCAKHRSWERRRYHRGHPVAGRPSFRGMDKLCKKEQPASAPNRAIWPARNSARRLPSMAVRRFRSRYRCEAICATAAPLPRAKFSFWWSALRENVAEELVRHDAGTPDSRADSSPDSPPLGPSWVDGRFGSLGGGFLAIRSGRQPGLRANVEGDPVRRTGSGAARPRRLRYGPINLPAAAGNGRGW